MKRQAKLKDLLNPENKKFYYNGNPESPLKFIGFEEENKIVFKYINSDGTIDPIGIWITKKQIPQIILVDDEQLTLNL